MALVVKDPPANVGDIRDAGSIPGSRRSPGGGHGSPLSSCLENPHEQRSLVGYGPWGRKELDTTKQLTHTHTRGARAETQRRRCQQDWHLWEKCGGKWAWWAEPQISVQRWKRLSQVHGRPRSKDVPQWQEWPASSGPLCPVGSRELCRMWPWRARLGGSHK